MDEMPEKRKRRFHLLLWWRIEPVELQTQIERCHNPGTELSIRDVSLWLTILAFAAFFLINLTHDFSVPFLLWSAIILVLGIFIYRGHRWATVAAMIFWTLTMVPELAVRVYQEFLLFQWNRELSPSPADILAVYAQTAPLRLAIIMITLVWWTSYMQIFLLAFRVETERGRR